MCPWSPCLGQTHGHYSQPAPAPALCIKQHFFLTWLLPHRRAGVPLREKAVAPLYIRLSIPGSLALWAPFHPHPLRSPWLCTPDSERLFTVWPRPQQRLAHLQKRLKRGMAAQCCGKGVPGRNMQFLGQRGQLGWAEGGPKAEGPWSSLSTILPAWPWGNPGSLRNKLIQITAREIYTRREPLPAAVLWAGAPALPCPRVPRPL